MKTIKWVFGLAFSLSSSLAIAGTMLKAPESDSACTSITEKAEKAGLSNVKIDSEQTFNIINNGKNLGALVHGKGWLRDVHPVCFIGWSKSSDSDTFFMQTMGADDWETVDCDKVESVGVISRSDEKNIKIAIIYKVDVRGQYSQDYVILGVKNNNKVYYDEKTTEYFQNSYLKNISELRKSYQNHQRNK